jgi:chaperonin GroES
MGMTFKPLNDKVVIELLEEDEKTETGIILPDTAKKRPQEGTVIAVGPGRLLNNGYARADDRAGRTARRLL